MSKPDRTDSAARDDAAMTSVMREHVVTRGDQKLVFRYRCGEERDALDQIARLAEDPDHPMDWHDAARLTHAVGQGLARRLADL